MFRWNAVNGQFQNKHSKHKKSSNLTIDWH